jgi:hypothetical protein
VWILHFLPAGFLEFVINSILVVGLISTVVTLFVINRLLMWFPALAGYYRLLQAASVAVFLLGVYLKGGYSTEMQWRERVAEAEARVIEAEQRSKEENVKIVEKVVKRIELVRTRGDDIIKYVDREVVKYDVKFAPGGVCEIPQEFIIAHNRAAEAPPK